MPGQVLLCSGACTAWHPVSDATGTIQARAAVDTAVFLSAEVDVPNERVGSSDEPGSNIS